MKIEYADVSVPHQPTFDPLRQRNKTPHIIIAYTDRVMSYDGRASVLCPPDGISEIIPSPQGDILGCLDGPH